MIEFKQIIGRGTRLFDGKDYFTIYDFVKAYEHFNDPEWDGEPVEPVEPSRRSPAKTGADRDADGEGEDGESNRAAKENQNKAGGWQRAHHPKYDGDQLLEPRR